MAAVGALLSLSSVLRAAPAGGGSSEYAVKAAFLYHFAQFVEWPERAFKAEDSPLVYCTVGADPFQGALDTSLSGKVIGKHPVQVRHLRQPQEAHQCQVVFIGEEERKSLTAVLASTKDSPVLVVGESEGFVGSGGMIGFCLEENKIRFDINLEGAEKAGLKISAKLLSLAKTVVGGPKKG